MVFADIAVQTLQIALPAYLANASPTLLIKLKKHPIDFGLKHKGNRLLGDGKTIEGFIMACIIGYLSGFLVNYLTSFTTNIELLIIPQITFLFIGVGAMVGDAVGSFIKRRLNMKRGQNAGLLDKIDFIIGAFLFARIFVAYSWLNFLLALIITPIIHRLANIIGYKIGVKKEPW